MRFKALVRKFYQRYLLDAMSAMALGLFASLIIGLILTQLSMIPALKFLADYGEIVSASSPVVGAAIGVAIAYGLKVAPLAMFSSAATGALGYQLGGPVGAYFAAVVGAELGNLVAGKTKVDIIVVPIVSIVSGCFIATWSAPGINNAVAALQRFLEMATTLQPIPMGIIVSVVFGLALDRAHLLGGAGGHGLHRGRGRSDGRGPASCGGRGHGRLLRADGGLRRGQLSGKTASPASSPRASAPPCCRWATSSRIRPSSCRPPSPRPSPALWRPRSFK